MPNYWIDVVSETEFGLSRAGVYEQLLGRKHTFNHDSRSVTISLPTKSAIEKRKREFPTDPRIWIGQRSGSGPRRKDGKIFNWYSDLTVRVSVEIPTKLRVPRRALMGAPNMYVCMCTSEQKRAQALLKSAIPVAFSAFLYWLRVMRWQTKSGLIGQPNAENIMDTYGASLIVLGPRKSFGYGTGHMTVRAIHILDQTDWANIGKMVKRGVEPPLWSEILFEAEAFAACDNIRAAIAYYAFACETFLRSMFMSQLPNDLNANVYEIIDRQLSVRALMTRYASREFKSKLSNGTLSTIHRLIDARDDVVHRGLTGAISNEDLVKFRTAARDLVFQGNR